MKKKRLTNSRERKSMMVSLRMPEDVVKDLKRVAPLKGMTGYQALIKYYVGVGLQRDLETLWLQEVPERIEGILNKHGISDDVRNDLLEELLGVVPHQRTEDANSLGNDNAVEISSLPHHQPGR